MSTAQHKASYRLTRRGEAVLIVAPTLACLMAIAVTGFGLMVGWFG